MKINLNEYVILYKPSKTQPRHDTFKATKRGRIRGSDAKRSELKIETAELSYAEINDLGKDPKVGRFAPIMPMKLHEPIKKEVVQDTGEGKSTWGVIAVGADTCPYTGEGVRVAVLDTGIDANHPAFHGVEIIQEDFTGDGNGDDNGHGTHVAGTIFGQNLDRLRIGVAPGIEQALVGKVLDAGGGGSTKSITQAMEWALNNGANVISMSLGMDFPGLVKAMEDDGYPTELATSRALESYRANVNLFNAMAQSAKHKSEFFQTAIILAATGNESRRHINPKFEIAAAPPAAATGILAIGALGQENGGLVVADFSNTKPVISAPGVEVISARSGGGLEKLSGTSMATPHAAGVAALWAEKLSQNMGTIGPDVLSAKLIACATHDPLKKGYNPLDVGMGIVQAPQA